MQTLCNCVTYVFREERGLQHFSMTAVDGAVILWQLCWEGASDIVAHVMFLELPSSFMQHTVKAHRA